MTGAPPVAPIVSCCATLLLAVASPCFAAERYVRASVNQAGQLRIMTSDGRAIVLEKGLRWLVSAVSELPHLVSDSF